MTEQQTSQNVQRKHPLAECESCPLYEDSIFVPSYGPEKAEVCLVGEAPGKDEATKGIPFVGLSGKLLDQILPSVGLRREEIFITNTCLCRPKDNVNPPAQAVRSCHTRLVEELKGRSPKVVLALGNFAARAILDTSEGITKLRVGPPKRSPLLDEGTVVIPTFHPAASLYNSGAFPDIVTDFEKIPDALGREVVSVTGGWVPPEIRIYDTERESVGVLKELLGATRLKKITVDIETGWEKDVDLGRADRSDLLCIGISHRPGAAIVLGENSLGGRHVDHLLGQLIGEKQITAQNGKFDLAGLSRYNREGALHALSFDTMLAHYCIDERRGTHSLDQLAVEFLGSPDWKAEFRRHLSGHDYASAPRELLYKYNAYDASNTYLLEDVLGERLDAEALRGVHDFLVRTSPVLMRMEMNGLGVDLAYNIEAGDELELSIAGYRKRLQEITEDSVYNPNSWQQVQQALKFIFGKRVKDTRADTIQLVMENAARIGDQTLYEFCEAHLAFKKEAKSFGTYIKGIRKRAQIGDDGFTRVYTDFLLHGTVTGRLASRNPNLQNITRGSYLRRQFVPTSPDNVFIQADYGQAELRVVCWLARDAYLREVLSDSTRDIHGEVAERFFGSGWTKEQRVRAKAVVFGLTYGREAFSLAAEHRWPVRTAQQYIDYFFSMIPDTVNWIKQVEETVLGGEDLVTPFGRHRRFWLITDKNRDSVLKEGRAFLPQSTASDITLEAANRLARLGFWDNIRILIHDAIVMEVPASEAQTVAETMKEVMEMVGMEVNEGYVPFPVDIKIGKNWGELD